MFGFAGDMASAKDDIEVVDNWITPYEIPTKWLGGFAADICEADGAFLIAIPGWNDNHHVGAVARLDFDKSGRPNIEMVTKLPEEFRRGGRAPVRLDRYNYTGALVLSMHNGTGGRGQSVMLVQGDKQTELSHKSFEFHVTERTRTDDHSQGITARFFSDGSVLAIMPHSNYFASQLFKQDGAYDQRMGIEFSHEYGYCYDPGPTVEISSKDWVFVSGNGKTIPYAAYACVFQRASKDRIKISYLDEKLLKNSGYKGKTPWGNEGPPPLAFCRFLGWMDDGTTAVFIGPNSDSKKQSIWTFNFERLEYDKEIPLPKINNLDSRDYALGAATIRRNVLFWLSCSGVKHRSNNAVFTNIDTSKHCIVKSAVSLHVGCRTPLAFNRSNALIGAEWVDGGPRDQLLYMDTPEPVKKWFDAPIEPVSAHPVGTKNMLSINVIKALPKGVNRVYSPSIPPEIRKASFRRIRLSLSDMDSVTPPPDGFDVLGRDGGNLWVMNPKKTIEHPGTYLAIPIDKITPSSRALLEREYPVVKKK